MAISGALLRSVLQASIKAKPGVDTPDETIDGFPEFNVDVDTIHDPTVEQKLRALAKKIVASHSTPNRIIGFEVHGHADQTLRFPPGTQRDQFEQEISQDRAEHARDLLLKFIEEEPEGKARITGIRANADAQGFGTRFRIFVPATTEIQMRRNRRIEIFLKRFNQPPPKPSPPSPPKPPPKPDVGTHWRIRIIDGSIITVGVPVSPGVTVALIQLKVDIVDLDRKQKATFNADSEGLALPSLQSILRPLPANVTLVGASPPRDFVTFPAGVTLNSFNGNVLIHKNPSAGVAIKTVGGEFAFDFDALSPILTRPRVVEVKAQSADLGRLLVPAFGGGVVGAIGTMKMEGSPVSAP